MKWDSGRSKLSVGRIITGSISRLHRSRYEAVHQDSEGTIPIFEPSFSGQAYRKDDAKLCACPRTCLPVPPYTDVTPASVALIVITNEDFCAAQFIIGPTAKLSRINQDNA